MWPSRISSPGRARRSRRATSCSSRSTLPRPRAGNRQRLRSARVPPADGDRGRRRDGRRHARRRRRCPHARVAITALAPTIRRVPEAEEALIGQRRRTQAPSKRRRVPRRRQPIPISDVRASERYRRAMAAVIARRAIEAALARARGGDVPSRPAACRRRSEGRRHPHGQRRRLPGRARAGHEPPRRRPRRRRAHRREGGLRRLGVRRLHDAARRPAGELLLLPRAPGRGQRGHDRRGPRGRRRAEPAPDRVPRARRRPVRLLHAGDADLGNRSPRRTHPTPSEDEVRIALSGNLCRCTGYDGIVKAVLAVSRGTAD